ncbi:unnamed protein product [Didymodactylos carnosus]|uniref:Endonuclease/exonuclease/phosphatase domain-containing protein n=1 Tax=Didymodactylos carnosus TaxID=1234261 RepID=A0A813UCZ1_9BILA|nr:unnamed protein product [Didymodactylos carnosus]CAF3607423.1 unnamed protein product [Didymodactylos carnosus]
MPPPIQGQTQAITTQIQPDPSTLTAALVSTNKNMIFSLTPPMMLIKSLKSPSENCPSRDDTIIRSRARSNSKKNQQQPHKTSQTLIDQSEMGRDELTTTYNDVDVYSVNETKLNDKMTSFSLTGYNIFRQDRDEKGGGVLLAIRNKYQVNLIYNGIIENNELVVIELELKQNKTLIVASIYVPPKIKLSIKVLNKIKNLNDQYLIISDLNASHEYFGCAKTNRNDSYAEKLDWMLSDIETSSLASNFCTHPILGTTIVGHKPITFDLYCEVDDRPRECAQKQFIFSQANWIVYHRELNRRLNTREVEEVDNSQAPVGYSQFITDCIAGACQLAVPEAELYKRFTSVKPSKESLKLIKKKHQFYRQLQKNPINTRLKDEYYKIRVLVQNSLSNDSRIQFKNLMKNLSTPKMRSDQLWSVVNRFHEKRTNRELKHEIKYRNKTAKFDQEKVDMFKTYFEEVYDNKPHNCIQHFDIDREIKQEIDRLTKIKTFTHPKIIENELKKVNIELRQHSSWS